MAPGMFDALTTLQRGQRQEDVDEQQRLQFLAQDPARARALTSYEMMDLAGRGIGQAASAFADRDPRTSTERAVANVDKAKAEMAGLGEVDFNNPGAVDAYYKKVISILSRNGLPGEAHAAAQEWNKTRNELTDRSLKEREIARKEAEGKAKAASEVEKNRIAAERNKILLQNGLPEVVKIVGQIESSDNPLVRQRLLEFHNAKLESMKKGVILEDAGDRVIVRNKATGEVLGTDTKGAEPMKPKDALKVAEDAKKLESGYKSAMLGMQTNYKAAADLYNHPGLDNLIGTWTGIAAEGKPGEMGREAALLGLLNDKGREALALFQQVRGATFIKALKDLKESGGGHTGLGAVSEIEGDKIQAANNGLFPRQQPAAFRRRLSEYIDTLEASAELLGQKAQVDKLAPIYLNIVPLTGPKGKPAPAPTRPKAG